MVELTKKELKKEYDKKHNWVNRKKKAMQSREYYLLHRDEKLAYCAKYRSENLDKVRATSKKCNKSLNLREKMAALIYYGGGKMACVKCGFNDIRALSIDHIDGGGKAHTRSIHNGKLGGHFYHWLKCNDYPEGYQTLCMNCQWIKRSENNEG